MSPLSAPDRGGLSARTGTRVPFTPSSCFVPQIVQSPSGLRVPPHTPQDWSETSTVAFPFVATSNLHLDAGRNRPRAGVRRAILREYGGR